MSLYVEIGFRARRRGRRRARCARACSTICEREGVIDDHQLVAEHSVVMDPAYVHITQARSPSTRG